MAMFKDESTGEDLILLTSPIEREEYYLMSSAIMMSLDESPKIESTSRTLTNPKTVTGYSLVPVNDKVYLIGGEDPKHHTHSDKIYKLSCKNRDCKWEEVDLKLETARSHFLAFASSKSEWCM